MSLHYHVEIERLKKKLLAMSAVVEEDLILAIKAVRQRDRESAEKIITADTEINAMEIDVEEDCLKILALYQPVARDLRFIVAVLKINAELERIGDLATNIAERAIALAANPGQRLPPTIEAMAEKSIAMVKRSLDALVEVNADLAREVCILDDEVDALNRDSYTSLREQMQRTPDRIEELLGVLSISRYLERISDHATNIAEDVIYLIEGDIIRHQI